MPLQTRIVSAVIIVCLAVWAIISFPTFQGKPNTSHLSAEMRAALDEANRDFTYNGNPIHPLLVKEFSIWFSDYCSPVTVSVDVASASKARNEYNSTTITVDGSIVRSENPEIDGFSGYTGYYQYERLGILTNGLQVLRISESGGGSGLFEDLLFVKFTTGSAYHKNGDTYERLLMTVVREFPLGDRDDGSIRIEADKVIISASRYRSEPTILRF